MPAALKTKELSNEFVTGSRMWSEPSVNPIGQRDPDELRLDARAVRTLRLDAEIESDVSILADSVFSDGLEIVPAIMDEEDEESTTAAEIADFMRVAISDAQRPFESVLKEMFKGAFYYGTKVGEIVLRLQTDARVDGKLVLDRINAKPPSATAFVTDRFYNVLGLVGARRPGQTIVTTGSVSLSKDEIIPREKFLILSFELENNDPRGLSQVRAAFEPYCDKKLSREQWKEWRRTSAIPKKVGITPEKAIDVTVKKSDGSPLIEDGVPKVITAQKALMNSLEGFANNSAITAPYGTDIKQLEVSGKGEQFVQHFKSCNGEIRKVILGDSLITGEADKDARAARESSKDVSDIKKQALRSVVEQAVERDVFQLLTVVNFGADKAHLTPKCFLGDTEATDWATDLNAASKAGYSFAPEHFKQLDAQFGVEPRQEQPDAITPEPLDPSPAEEMEDEDE